MSGLKVNKAEVIIHKAMISAERMMFTADKSALVPDGDPRAASLAVPYGRRIHPDMVKRFGIKNGKMAKVVQNKLGKKAENKGK